MDECVLSNVPELSRLFLFHVTLVRKESKRALDNIAGIKCGPH